QDNRNFQDDTNTNPDINEGVRDSANYDDSDSDDASSEYDEDKRNLAQEGYADDTDFGQKPVERYPDPKNSAVDDDSDDEEHEEVQEIGEEDFEQKQIPMMK
ncbi:MAG TPA: hypothetical protein VLR29_02455, partial [Flavobacterium sp.]|nr:hypothetical protein [Flavobacterium sp.]